DYYCVAWDNGLYSGLF
nr:immunoglobulin light chain junction region [Macaca mulatta]MOW58273.1 immunoglobulin light chain junction region [Macaca mulatta]